MFSRLPVIVLFLLLCSLGIVSSSQANVFNVNTTLDEHDNLPGDGICRALIHGSFLCTLRAAIEESNDLAGIDSVNLPRGNYSITIQDSIRIRDQVNVTGVGAALTIVDATQLLGEVPFSIGNRTFFKGFSIYNATGNGNGGAIIVGASFASFEDMKFLNNSAPNNGGAIHVVPAPDEFQDTILNFNRVVFSHNHSGNNGGAISAFSCIRLCQNITLNLTQVDFLNNQAGGSGGAIIVTGPVHLISKKNRFYENTATGGGGAILSTDEGIHSPAVLTIDDSYFTLNQALNGMGGAIVANDLTMNNTTVTKNTAFAAAGGGIYLESLGGDSSIITNSTISLNQATNGGGIYYIQEAGLKMVNVTVSSNLAQLSGGGIEVYNHLNYQNADLYLIYVTLYANRAGMGGPGIAYTQSNNSDPLRSFIYPLNSIISGNILLPGAPVPAWMDANIIDLEQKGCLFLDSDGSNIFGTLVDCMPSHPEATDLFHLNNPLLGLGPLANNGGNTQTHALLPGSRAINNGQCIADTNQDQRGVQRPQNNACDIGAFEAKAAR